jgi:hypothetical protein
MSRWIARAISCVAALTAIVFIVDAAVSIASGTYLNLGSGVWLGLARDAHDGIFYRPLWNGAEYGGTRYFPMLFVLTAGVMRTGVAAVPAGVTVSVIGLVAMAAAVAVFLKRLDVPWSLVLVGTALSAAPYFVHQTAFAIRCEPLAAALAIFGLAMLPPLEGRGTSTRHLLFAAGFFVAAFMTKITCVYAPAAATLALFAAGLRGAAVKLAAFTAAGALVLLGTGNMISGGRALESFRACALAGSSAASLFSVTAVTRAVQLIGTSHLLTVIFLLSIVALALSRGAWLKLPQLYFVGAAAITAVIFTSPGTILTSQILDAYVAAIVVLTTAVSAQPERPRAAALAILIALGFWTAGQNISRIAGMIRTGIVRTGVEDQRSLVDQVNRCGDAIVSESALIPILAGQRPVLLDPFAFHVVALNRPEVEQDLVNRIRHREFACVVLEQDPETPKGRAWYSNVNLTHNVVDAIRQHYELERTIAGERFFRPVQ